VIPTAVWLLEAPTRREIGEGLPRAFEKRLTTCLGLIAADDHIADDDFSVAVQRALPDEPKLFALVHELKHHYRDQALLTNGRIVCGDYNANELIEKGAEVFAAEFIYPEAEFAGDIARLGITAWSAEAVVHMKRGCKAKVSYKFLCKRLERLGLIVSGQFERIQFQKLEERMFGVPFYRRRRAS
jgi:Zn-dependent peptidase ImmA (M78 family)